jgi:heme exporter protein B
MIRDAATIARKDLLLEARSKVAVSQVLPFVLAVVLLFGFALDGESRVLQRVASGLFWTTVLFSAVLVIQRSFAVERADGVTDALRMSGLAPGGIFLGKVVSLFAQILVVDVTLAVAMVVLYDVSPSGVALLCASGVLGSLAVSAAGALYGPLVSGARHRDTLLPLLLLPVLAPVLLAGSRAFEIALGRGVGGGWQWAGMLGIVAGVYLALGIAVWGPLLEDT